jgi:hypothetical protein
MERKLGGGGGTVILFELSVPESEFRLLILIKVIFKSRRQKANIPVSYSISSIHFQSLYHGLS